MSNQRKIEIYPILGHGRANAMPMREVSAYFGISDTETKKIVQSERKEGYPIVSCSHGYFLGSPAEVKEFANHLYAEGLSKIDLSANMIRGQVAEVGSKEETI